MSQVLAALQNIFRAFPLENYLAILLASLPSVLVEDNTQRSIKGSILQAEAKTQLGKCLPGLDPQHCHTASSSEVTSNITDSSADSLGNIDDGGAFCKLNLVVLSLLIFWISFLLDFFLHYHIRIH